MQKRMLSRSIVCVGILVFFSSAALAQDSKGGVITINGGRTAVYMKAPSQISTPAFPSDSKLVKIYSNLGTGKSVYNPSVGNGIIGPKAGQKFPEWIGCGFRPKADHTVTEIQVGVTYVQGTNGVTLSLNADNQDRPGKAHLAVCQSAGFWNLLYAADRKVNHGDQGQKREVVLGSSSHLGEDTRHVGRTGPQT